MIGDALLSASCRGGRFFDETSDLLGMRDENHVAGVDLGGFRPDSLRIESFEIGIDRSVPLRHDVPRRNRFPGCSRWRCGECRPNYWLLSGGHYTGLR